MIPKQRWLILGSGLALCLAGLGFLRSPAEERLGLVSRGKIPNPSNETLRRWQTDPVRVEERAPARPEAGETPWVRHLRRVEEALAQKKLSEAEFAWHEAYAWVRRSRRWEGLVDVGAAYLRIGEVAGARQPSQARARQLYLAALVRARQQGSLDGVLRAAEAFAALGDREVADQALRVAEGLAARGDAEARDRVRALAEQLAWRSRVASNPEAEPW